MGHQGLILIAAALFIATIGCESSMEISEDDQKVSPLGINVDLSKLESEKEQVEEESSQRKSAGGGGAGTMAARKMLSDVNLLGVNQAITHFHASNGRYPKSHEEFMAKVWKPLNAPMPKVEEGYEIRYIPELRKVQVVRMDNAASVDGN